MKGLLIGDFNPRLVKFEVTVFIILGKQEQIVFVLLVANQILYLVLREEHQAKLS